MFQIFQRKVEESEQALICVLQPYVTGNHYSILPLLSMEEGWHGLSEKDVKGDGAEKPLEIKVDNEY